MVGYVGWDCLPGKYIRVGGEHTVVTDKDKGTTERLCCSSAGGGDARFTARDPEDFRVLVVPWEEWAERILDLADEAEVDEWRKR